MREKEGRRKGGGKEGRKEVREGGKGRDEEGKEGNVRRPVWWAGMCVNGLINISGWMNAWIKTWMCRPVNW